MDEYSALKMEAPRSNKMQTFITALWYAINQNRICYIFTGVQPQIYTQNYLWTNKNVDKNLSLEYP